MAGSSPLGLPRLHALQPELLTQLAQTTDAPAANAAKENITQIFTQKQLEYTQADGDGQLTQPASRRRSPF
jgi:hypothetical protein